MCIKDQEKVCSMRLQHNVEILRLGQFIVYMSILVQRVSWWSRFLEIRPDRNFELEMIKQIFKPNFFNYK